MLSDQKDFEKFEKLYSIISEQVEREYAEKYSKKSKNNKSDRELSGIDDGEELWQLLENSNDVSTMEVSEHPIKSTHEIDSIILCRQN